MQRVGSLRAQRQRNHSSSRQSVPPLPERLIRCILVFIMGRLHEECAVPSRNSCDVYRTCRHFRAAEHRVVGFLGGFHPAMHYKTPFVCRIPKTAPPGTGRPTARTNPWGTRLTMSYVSLALSRPTPSLETNLDQWHFEACSP